MTYKGCGVKATLIIINPSMTQELKVQSVPTRVGEADTDYRRPAVRNGARRPNVLHKHAGLFVFLGSTTICR
jgi:hypothetical protein